MNLIKLPSLLAAEPKRLLALGTKEVFAAQWQQRLASWQAYLDSYPQVRRVALFVHDRAEFSAALIALWLCGKEAWLAPNNVAETTRQLGMEVDAFIGDFPHLAGADVCLQVDQSVAQMPGAQIPVVQMPVAQKYLATEIDPAAVLVLFTSGSSGKPQKVFKQVHQLAAEIQQLEKSFGADIQDACVYSTVSHQHIYGLLFSLLWPLSHARPFARLTTEYVEELFASQARKITLISSPTHLSRLPLHLPMRASFALVFSSGAPLVDSASQLAHEKLNAPIVEVFGSTETGGIAWRVQHETGSDWQLFEAVEAKTNAQQCLMIRSAFLPSADWFESSDVVSLSGARFSLIGRADRIVKVEGKRVSLAQVETFLLRDLWVDDVRVEQVQRVSHIAVRDELMAIVVLSASGLEQLNKQGRLALAKYFKNTLAQVLERPLLPRRWRYVESLPRNSQGKLVHEEFQAMLESLQSKVMEAADD